MVVYLPSPVFLISAQTFWLTKWCESMFCRQVGINHRVFNEEDQIYFIRKCCWCGCILGLSLESRLDPRPVWFLQKCWLQSWCLILRFLGRNSEVQSCWIHLTLQFFWDLLWPHFDQPSLELCRCKFSDNICTCHTFCMLVFRKSHLFL